MKFHQNAPSLLYTPPHYTITNCWYTSYMKLNNSDRSLESFKIFPYVAWTLVFLFALFVYNITMELKAVAENLQMQTEWLQERIDTPSNQFTDFEA